jgi:hypothetical protein
MEDRPDWAPLSRAPARSRARARGPGARSAPRATHRAAGGNRSGACATPAAAFRRPYPGLALRAVGDFSEPPWEPKKRAAKRATAWQAGAVLTRSVSTRSRACQPQTTRGQRVPRDTRAPGRERSNAKGPTLRHWCRAREGPRRCRRRASHQVGPGLTAAATGLLLRLRSTCAQGGRPRRLKWVTVDGGLPAGLDLMDRSAMHEWLRRNRT